MARILKLFLHILFEPDRSHATVRGGILAGLLFAGAYAALEMLLSGPLHALLNPQRMIGSWYAGVVSVYYALYLMLGALAGAVVGSVLSLGKRPAHHVSILLSASVMLLFAVNSFAWDRTVFRSPFLVVVVPVAVWMLAGLLSERTDPSRAVVASPWFTAILLLGPIWISRELLLHQPLPLRVLSSCALVAVLFLAAFAARREPSVLALARPRPHAVLTAAIFILSYAVLLGVRETPIVSAMLSAVPAKLPNLILISLDTMRADHLSVYGYPRRTTPHLERFAAEATLYRNAFSNGDFTLPSHASMLTGRYPSQHGAVGDLAGFHPIDSSVPTLAELLKKAGYFTAAAVANHGYLNSRFGFHRGFDRMMVPEPVPAVSPTFSYHLRAGLYELTLPWVWTDALRSYMPAEYIVELGEAAIAQAGKRPFFLFLNLMDSHRPWVSRGRFRKMFLHYDQRAIRWSTQQFFREVLNGTHVITDEERLKMHAAYDGGIAYVDDTVGRLLDRLRQTSWYDQSLIIITSDHGDLFGADQLIDHGNSLNHGATRIPFLVKFPAQKEGREVKSPVSLVDVFSTLGAAAGVPANVQDAGVNLASGDPGEERDIFLESYPIRHMAAENPRLKRTERAMVKGRWRLIESDRGRHDLYDIMSDPEERHNLWNARMDIAQDMGKRLHEWAARARQPSNSPLPDPKRLQNLKALGYAQ